MAGETTKTPTDRMIERLEKRQARRFQVGRMASTFSRLGVADPWSAAPSADQGPAGLFTGSPHYAMLRRMFAADEAREKRFAWLFSRTTGSIGTRFATMRVRPTTHRLASSDMGGGDLLLVRAETQLPPVEEPAQEIAARPRQARTERRRDRSVRVARAVRQLGLSRAVAPAPRAAIAEPILPRREPAERRAATRRPASLARPTRARADRKTAAMIASLEAVVRSIPYTQEAQRVSALVADLREASPETWPARIREVVREIDATSAEIAAEVEASLPDELARPMTVAVSRAPAADEVRARGLRTVTSRSPMVRALQQEPTAKAHPASRVRAERLAGSRARTAARGPRRVSRSRGASVRRAAQRLGGAARAEAGSSGASADGPAPEPAAIELDRLSARGERRRMSAAARSVVDDAATVREIAPVEPAVQAEQAAATPRPRVVGSVSRAEPRARKVSSAHVASRLATNAGDHWIASAQRAPSARPARETLRRAVASSVAPSSVAPEAPRSRASSLPADAREALAPVLERVLHRVDAPREIGLRPAFYQRLGVEAPAIATAQAPVTPSRDRAEVAAASPVRRAAAVTRVELPETPARGIERLAVARVLRDAREQAFQAQHGEPRMRAASRSWPGEARAHRAPVLSIDAMNLPPAPAIERTDEAAPETAPTSRRARVAAERAVAMPAATDHGLVGRAPATRAVAAIESPPRVASVASPRAVVGRSVRATTRSPLRAFSAGPVASLPRSPVAVAAASAVEPTTPELRRDTPRAAERAGARLEAVLTGASQVVRAIEKAAGGRVDAAVVARVSEAISAIEAAPLERGARAAAVRRALRGIGPVARLGEVESAAPAVASPVTVAGARAAEPTARLGLRRVLGSSPAMVAATPPLPVVADAEAGSTAAEPSRRTPSRAPRLSASPVAGRAAPGRAAAVTGATPAVRAPAQVASAPARAPRAPSRAAPSPISEELASAPSRAASAHVVDRLIAAEARQIVGALDEVDAPAATRAASRAELGQASGQSLLPRVAAGRSAPGRATAGRAVASARAESQPQRASLRARRVEPGRAVASIPGAPTPVFASLPEVAPAEIGAEVNAPRAVAPRGVATSIAEVTAMRAVAPRGVAASIAEDRPVAARTVRAAVRAAERAHVGEPRSRSTLPEVTPHRAIEALKTRILRGSSASEMVLAEAAPEPLAVETEVDARGATARRVTRELAAAPTRAAAPAAIASRSARFEAPIAEPRASVLAGPRAVPAARAARAARSPSVAQSVRALARLTDSPVLAAAAERALNATPEAQVALLREVAARGPAAYARAARGEDRGVVTGRTRRLPVGPDGVLAQPAAIEAVQTGSAQAASAATARRAPAIGRPLDWAGDRAAAAPSAQPRAGAVTPARAERGGGVVELLREARAVQELVRSLSRAPVGASRAARLGPVAAARLMSARNAETIAPRDAARLTRQILGDAFQVLAAGSSPEVGAAVEATPLSRVAIRGERTIDVASPRVSRRVLGDVVDALARAVAGAAEVAAERADTPVAGRRIMRPLAGAPETIAQARPTPSAAKRYVETPRRERRPALDEVYAAPFRGASEPEAATVGGRAPGARARPRDLGRTLGAVEDGNPEAGLPIWAQRATGGTRVAGTSSGLLETLARAKEPGDVIRAIERGESSLRGPSKIPVPVLRLLDEIRAEAGQVADAEARAALEGATGQAVNTISQDRGIRAAGPRSTSRVFHGYTNLAPAKQSAGVDGLGPDRLMKLVRRLQQLIFLADSQRDAAMRQVRLAEDSAAARSEGAAAPTQAGDARSKQVDIEALAHDVLDKVHEIQESRGQRRLDDPDNRSVWW